MVKKRSKKKAVKKKRARVVRKPRSEAEKERQRLIDAIQKNYRGKEILTRGRAARFARRIMEGRKLKPGTDRYYRYWTETFRLAGSYGQNLHESRFY